MGQNVILRTKVSSSKERSDQKPRDTVIRCFPFQTVYPVVEDQNMAEKSNIEEVQNNFGKKRKAYHGTYKFVDERGT